MTRKPRRPRLLVCYHVFHPSDNVSAHHLSDLAVGLARRGWDVTACPANRNYPDGSQTYLMREEWQGVHIRRVWRPNWRQSGGFGRIANALWMIAAWSVRAFTTLRNRPDVVLIGTDPVLSVLAAIPWKLFRSKVAHWGFDIYPEAAIAEGMLHHRSLLVRCLRPILKLAYRCCDVIVDIGPCMRQLLKAYGSNAVVATLTPWALVEPDGTIEADPTIRQTLFGDARLGLLYSGTFGRAHSYDDLLELAHRLRGESIAFCFAGRGNRADQLRAAVTPEDSNVRFAGFASLDELEKRLGAADLHLVSLRPEWTGSVVPSKFFGSLAMGRPVVFAGSENAAIARWVREFQIGWVLTRNGIDEVANELRTLVRDVNRLRELQERCRHVYRQSFSRDHIIDDWDRALRAIKPQ